MTLPTPITTFFKRTDTTPTISKIKTMERISFLVMCLNIVNAGILAILVGFGTTTQTAAVWITFASIYLVVSQTIAIIIDQRIATMESGLKGTLFTRLGELQPNVPLSFRGRLLEFSYVRQSNKRGRKQYVFTDICTGDTLWLYPCDMVEELFPYTGIEAIR